MGKRKNAHRERIMMTVRSAVGREFSFTEERTLSTFIPFFWISLVMGSARHTPRPMMMGPIIRE